MSFFLCTHKSLWVEGCCVGQQAQSFHSFSTNLCAPSSCFPSSPSLVFYPFFLSLKTRVQRTNIPWLVSGMPDSASGHWSPLPILLGATAGKQPPIQLSELQRHFKVSLLEEREWCRPGTCLLGFFCFPICQWVEDGWGGGVSMCLSFAG